MRKGATVGALKLKVGREAVIVAAVMCAAGVGSVIVIASHEPHPDLAAPARIVAPGLVRLDAPEGKRLLFESEANAAFLPLVSYFETQKTLTHCGPASIAMVLNALSVPAPTATAYGSYPLFTQENVLNGLTESIVTDRAVERRGMALTDVAQVLAVYGVSVDTRYAGTSSVREFRKLAVEHLERPGGHVIVNYSRTALQQDGPGHISPLGAYDADSDRFLILDVSRYKAPAVWVSTAQLFAAMAEPLAPDNARTRGFLLIRAPSDNDRRPASAPPT